MLRIVEGLVLAPDEMKVVGDAFDKAWERLAPAAAGEPLKVQATRLKLAAAVLELYSEGITEVDRLAHEAMRRLQFSALRRLE